ncbi:MAG: flagellar hook-length control protein FliK [Lawsonibacter sp.]|nr:flagellar hook-length control protein FliK [Lawsonibacter sp.]
MNAINLTADQIMPSSTTQATASQPGKRSNAQEPSEFSTLVQQKYKGAKAPPGARNNPGDDTADDTIPDVQYALAASLTVVQPMLLFFPDQTGIQLVPVDGAPTLSGTQIQTPNVIQPESLGAATTAAVSELGLGQSAETPQVQTPTPAAASATAPFFSPAPPQSADLQAQATTQQSGDGQLGSGTQKQSEDALPSAAAQVQAPLFPLADAVPIPVGLSDPRPVDLPSSDAAGQLSNRLTQALAQGTSKLEVHLSPQSLGDLSVEITRTDDGSLSVILKPTTAEAMSLLVRHSSSLQNLLAANTQSPVRVEVQQQTSQTDIQQFLNPDGSGDHSRQQQRQQPQKQNFSQDFLQQLRLGLTELEPVAV